MGWTRIDRSRWKREEYFRHYYEDVPCFYSMTVPLDVTRLRAAGLRLYPAMLYLLSRAVDRHEEFRCALVNGEVGVYDALSPSYTVFFSFRYDYAGELQDVWGMDAFRQLITFALGDSYRYGRP